MRLLVMSHPIDRSSLLGGLSRSAHQVSARVFAFWARWRRWEYRYEAVWFAIIGLLLLIYAWILFTGSVARRH